MFELPLLLKEIAPDDSSLTQAFSDLEGVYDRVAQGVSTRKLRCDMRGVCCDFSTADHVLYATKLEIAHFVSQSGTAKGVSSTSCPWFIDGGCMAREGRVLGCRVYFCMDTVASAELYEVFLAEIKTVHRKRSIEYAYVPVFKYLSEQFKWENK